MNQTPDDAYNALVEILQARADEPRETSYGNGFSRWVGSYAIKYQMSLDFNQVRKLMAPLVKEKKVLVLPGTGTHHTMYSTLGWDDHKIEQDYFIEAEEM